MRTRAKFRCNTVEQSSTAPVDAQRYNGPDQPATTVKTWPRTYRFTASYDESIPEDQRYARYTPSGSLTITVDNPAVEFELGKSYYLDITPADEG